MERLAIIDLGSNTCRLVIFRITPEGAYRLTDQVSESVRIGEGMLGRGELQNGPMQRVLDLLKLYAALCRAHQIETVIATATSAVRDAANGMTFVERVAAETGIRLRILTGEEEAYYAYVGAINGLKVRDGIVADLGGGSLELVRVQNRLPVAMTSLPLGAVRLSERFLRDDPLAKSSIKAVAAYAGAQMDAFPWLKLDHTGTLVALGGTVRALAQVDRRRRGYPVERLHAYLLTREAVEEITEELLKKTAEARARIKGMKGERADIIPAGALVVRELMRHVGADKLVVSGRGLREGLLYEKLLAEDERNNSPSMTVARLSAGTAVPLLPDVRAFGVANASFLYVLDWVHAQQVCRLALELFDGLAGHYGLVPEERALLTYASLLHDCGSLIDYYRHHHHSAYLVENADLPGFTHDELAYLALLVRWHRHGEPSLDLYDTLLTGADLERIDKLVPCLRMAEDLERSRAQLVTGVRVRVHGAEIEIEAQMRESAAAELWAANRETGLWTQAFGKKVHVTGRVAPTQPTEPSPPVQETVSARAAWIQTMTR